MITLLVMASNTFPPSLSLSHSLEVLLAKVFHINFITIRWEAQFFCAVEKFLQVATEWATILYKKKAERKKLENIISLSRYIIRRYNYYHNFFSLNFYRSRIKFCEHIAKKKNREKFHGKKEKKSWRFIRWDYKFWKEIMELWFLSPFLKQFHSYLRLASALS